VRPGPPDAAGTAGMRPGPPGCGRDRRDAAGTAGMRPGPPGCGQDRWDRRDRRDAAELQAGSGLTHIESQNRSSLANGGQAGGQRQPVSLNTRRGAAERTIECELSH
jgi:hypothetical protein